MFKKKKFFLDKYFFVKNYTAGLALKKKNIFLLKKNIFNINFFFLKMNDNNICITDNKMVINLLLNKKEIKEIYFFKKNIKYNCIPIEIFKIKSLFKIKISIVKKRMKGFDVIK